MYDWVRQHFMQIVIGAGALVLISWLYGHAGRLLRSGPKRKSYCRHCNWEGTPAKKNPRCKKCGSRDLAPVTH